MKIHRNDPCRCGSGKKYKKCHLDEDREAERAFREALPNLREIGRRIQQAPERLRNEFGVYINYVAPVEFQGRKVWAIGTRLYADRPPNETFHEFLIHVLRETIGEPWRAAQVALPETERHFIMLCSDEYGKWKKANADPEMLEREGRFGANPNGWVQAFISLAWDVATLIHASNLPDSLVDRLRDPRAYQGARYEIAVAAIFARLDCQIRFLDEDERGRAGVQPGAAALPRPDPQWRAQGRAGLDAAAPLARAAHPAQPALRRRLRYGRRRTRKTPEGKTTVQELPREQWTALIPDAHPGYISFAEFERNQRLLAGNAHAYGAERAAGPAREGPALLQGLIVCGRCGRRMTVRYHQRRGIEVPDYQCLGESIQDGARRCQTIPGADLDAAIGQLLLDTVTPLALEVALTVQAELEARADEADQLRRSHVERARTRAELARRRYLTVDPDNRLVADTLEADWNDALRASWPLRSPPSPRPRR